jgi:hypothetical protein
VNWLAKPEIRYRRIPAAASTARRLTFFAITIASDDGSVILFDMIQQFTP